MKIQTARFYQAVHLVSNHNHITTVVGSPGYVKGLQMELQEISGSTFLCMDANGIARIVPMANIPYLVPAPTAAAVAEPEPTKPIKGKAKA